MKEKLKNKKILIVLIITLVILLLGGTFAWYVWQSSKTLISLNMCVPEISFVGGGTINGTGLKPITDKEQGLKKQIDVRLNSICKEGDSAVMNLYMTLDSLPTELQHETFIFEVVKDGKVLYSSNFKGKEEGTTITLLEDQVITEDTSTYWVYVYIDGTRDNPVNMSGKSFRFGVYGEGTNAIYKENVIANHTSPTDSSSVFLTSTLKRSEIEAITIAETNEVPEELIDTAEDISSNEDGSVMLWYEDSDKNGLYEVYMGSSNGIITANTNGSYMFAYLENVKYLDLTRLNTSNVTSMLSMFSECYNLQTIDLSSFDTSNVTSMRGMFVNCINLKELDLSNWDVSNVTSMRAMFESYDVGAMSLTTIGDVSNWDTSNVTSMRAMFQNCINLKELDLSNWDVSNVTDMYGMFSGHIGVGVMSLTTIGDVSNWDTSNVTDMRGMFQWCVNLTELDVSDWDTSKVTYMGSMFYNCSSLLELDVSNFDTSSVTDMSGMFYGCSSLTKLDVSRWNTSKVTTMGGMFYECSSLTKLDVSKWNTSKVTTMWSLFYGCSNLIELDLSSFNVSNVTIIDQMFDGCTNLTKIYVSNLWDISNVTTSDRMFANCISLIGSQGTTYNSSYIDITYARVDGGTSSPGYLTLKTA